MYLFVWNCPVQNPPSTSGFCADTNVSIISPFFVKKLRKEISPNIATLFVGRFIISHHQLFLSSSCHSFHWSSEVNFSLRPIEHDELSTFCWPCVRSTKLIEAVSFVQTKLCRYKIFKILNMRLMWHLRYILRWTSSCFFNVHVLRTFPTLMCFIRIRGSYHSVPVRICGHFMGIFLLKFYYYMKAHLFLNQLFLLS